MDLNGVPAAANKWLLTDVLRGGWGFEGFVVSDANAVAAWRPSTSPATRRRRGRALNAGLDMEMAIDDPATAGCPTLVAQGWSARPPSTRPSAGCSTAKCGLGLFENPYVDEDAAAPCSATPNIARRPDRGRALRRCC